MKNLLKSMLCLAAYFAVQMIVQIIFMMIGALTGIADQNGLIAFSMNHMLLVTLIANVVTVAFFYRKFLRLSEFAAGKSRNRTCLIWYGRVGRRSVKTECNMTPVKMKFYIYPAAAAFLLSSAWALVTYGLSFANAEQVAQSVTFYSDILPGLGSVLMAVTLLLAQPVTEEILCRGIMLNLLRKSFSVRATILTSALIFGLAHLMAGGAVLAFGAAIMGICFGIVYVKTKSLYAAVVAHAFANLPDFVMPLLPELQFGVRIVLAAVTAVISVVLLRMCSADQAAVAGQ